MGLDMYIGGELYFGYGSIPPTLPETNGLPIETVQLKLAYWRKHPNLHGYIVNTFANGVDDCRKIQLDLEDIDKILKGVRSGRLPHTVGFFFGESDDSPEQREEDITLLTRAKEWLASPTPKGVHRSVYYQASW